MNCFSCGDDGCEHCHSECASLASELKKAEAEYNRISVRIKEMYEDLINNEGITICFEELIKEMEAFKKFDKRGFRELVKNHGTERQLPIN